jgi:hypothetical protein
MSYRISYADGQAFDVELSSQEAVEWLLRLDYPDAVFVRGGGQITVWKDAAACSDGQQPVAVVERAGTSFARPG